MQSDEEFEVKVREVQKVFSGLTFLGKKGLIQSIRPENDKMSARDYYRSLKNVAEAMRENEPYLEINKLVNENFVENFPRKTSNGIWVHHMVGHLRGHEEISSNVVLRTLNDVWKGSVRGDSHNTFFKQVRMIEKEKAVDKSRTTVWIR